MVNVRLSDVTEKIYVEAFPISTDCPSPQRPSDFEPPGRFPEGFPLYVTLQRINGITPWTSSVYIATGQLLLPDFSDIAFDFELGKTLDNSRIPRESYSHVDKLEIKKPNNIEVRRFSEVRYALSALLEAIDGEPFDGRRLTEKRKKNGLEILQQMITTLYGPTNGEYSNDGNDIRERIEGVIKPLSRKAEQYVRQDYEKILRGQLSVGTFPLALEGKVYSFKIKDDSIQRLF